MINKLKSRNVINNLIIYFFSLPRKAKRFSRLINILSKIKEKNIIFLYISGIVIYCISLTHLSGLGMTCFFWEGIYCYYAIGILILISSFIISITIYIIIYKKHKKYHLIIISIFYSFLFIIDHNAGIVKHGLFNFISFMFITFILFIFILLLRLLRKEIIFHFLY